MKVIILTKKYYPNNSPRATRATELSLEFSRRGFQTEVFTLNPHINSIKIIKNKNLKINDYQGMFFSKLAFSKKWFPSFLYKVLNKIFKNIFEFPDIEFLISIPKIFKKSEEIDLLISIANPHPIHWGCARAKKKHKDKFPKVWLADCGDPYMGNSIQGHKKLSYFKYFEKWFARTCNLIIVPTKQAYKGYYQEFWNKIKVIPQGFDFKKYKIPKENNHEHENNKTITFAYAGAFYEKDRDPRPFLNYLNTIDIEFKFIVFTNNPTLCLLYKEKLKHKLEIKNYIDKEVLIKELIKMDFLVNFENRSEIQTPSKLIEYFLINKPVLSIPYNYLNKNIINEFLVFDFSNRMKEPNLEKYDIRNVCDQFISLYKESLLSD